MDLEELADKLNYKTYSFKQKELLLVLIKNKIWFFDHLDVVKIHRFAILTETNQYMTKGLLFLFWDNSYNSIIW